MSCTDLFPSVNNEKSVQVKSTLGTKIQGQKQQKLHQTYLTDSAMPSGLHMMLALVAGVNKAVLALGMQFHQHAHG